MTKLDPTGAVRRAVGGTSSRRSFLKRAGTLTAISAAAPLLAACGSGSGGGGAGTGGKKVALLLPSSAQKRWKDGDQAFFVAQAKKEGFEVVVQNANDDPTLQASQVDNVLTQGVSLIVLSAVNADTAKGMVQRASAQDVPVIAYNYVIPGVTVSATISRDAVDVGRQMAQAAVEARPKGNYVLAFGDQGTNVAVDKAKGQMAVLKPRIDAGDIKIVSERFNKDWSGDLTQKQTENALTANKNDIVAVIPSADSMSYGAIEALRAQGLDGKVFVCGEDAEVDALRAIKNGTMGATNFTPFDKMGSGAAKLAGQVLRGETIRSDRSITEGGKKHPWIVVDAFNVTTDNLDRFVRDNPWWAASADLT